MATSPWAGIKWSAQGLLALLIGTVLFLAAAGPLNLWLYADYYVPAELEVTRFNPQPGPQGPRPHYRGRNPSGRRADPDER